jgi:hypothetical protein
MVVKIAFKTTGNPEVRGSTNALLSSTLPIKKEISPRLHKIDHQRNSDIIGRLKVTDVVEEIQRYQEKWRNGKRPSTFCILFLTTRIMGFGTIETTL